MAVIDLADVEAIEEFPLSSCELPESTYAALQRTARVASTATALRFILDGNDFKRTYDWTYGLTSSLGVKRV